MGLRMKKRTKEMISIEPKNIEIKIKNNLYDETVELSEKDLIGIILW